MTAPQGENRDSMVDEAADCFAIASQLEAALIKAGAQDYTAKKITQVTKSILNDVMAARLRRSRSDLP